MIEELFSNNEIWARSKTEQDPDFFQRLVRQQRPDYLWIGCSDSRVPANDIVGLDPGELFVHRNVANIACPSDANFLSVLQFAVEALEIKHIIVCGHYGCGGVAAAMSGERHGLIDHWLQPVRDAADEYADHLLRIRDEHRRLDALCEANVARQVASIASNPIVQDRWRRQLPLAVHGWIYSIRNGLLKDLDISVDSFSVLSQVFPSRLSSLIGAPMQARERQGGSVRGTWT